MPDPSGKVACIVLQSSVYNLRIFCSTVYACAWFVTNAIPLLPVLPALSVISGDTFKVL